MANNRMMREWETFAQAVMPPNVSPLQVREMRRAFFGGVTSLMNVFQIVSRDDISEDAGTEMLEQVHEECRQFALGIKAGKF
jgi:hypothetical protein